MKNKFVRSTIILACFALAALFIPSLLIKFEIIDAYKAQIINFSLSVDNHVSDVHVCRAWQQA